MRRISTGVAIPQCASTSRPRTVAAQRPSRRSPTQDDLLCGLPELARRLRVGARLPSSGRSHVACVTDRTTHRRLVLKVLALERSSTWEHWDRFEHECTVVRSLRHGAVPTYVDHGRVGTRAFLLTERAPGRSLQQRLDRGERWTDAKLVHLLRRLLGAMTYLHELNPPIFHCDLHPEHVVVSDRGHVALTSFGRACSWQGDTEDESPGREGYAPPRLDHPAAPLRDLHALGCTVAAAACGMDASALPRSGGAIDLEQCMRPSVVREAIALLLRPTADDPAGGAREIAAWLDHRGR